MKYKKYLRLLLPLIVLFTLIVPVTVQTIPVNADSGTVVNANITIPAKGYVRGTFYAESKYWCFYLNTSRYIAYKTSANASIWSDEIVIDSSGNWTCFNVWYDGTYCYYGGIISFGTLYERRGIPNSDGTITWSAGLQQVYTPELGTTNESSISVDSNDYMIASWEQFFGGQ